ncbi:RNA-binding protein Mrd1 [Schizosaccharomyces japonicus yFS275]|uniref:Multiple RNA-binding domain-containing protein 1 n=1 Tax=Schizosaccharomyces japonicus (strain yFS275 / FY16936) TaxID=402676 RepID=B6JZY1_SCHJY|nr:RNA-binding protein Mrd1 [Schizosaccharomyces japonicus yFS275]EEB06131.2 RNA-binding protein Mrd1 [Schizosaccharomyces japonicus yFS275]
MSRIIVKNLPAFFDEEKIKQHFTSQSGYNGEITDVKLAKLRDGTSRRFAFLGFKNSEDAQDAVKFFNKTFVCTSKLDVQLAFDPRTADQRIKPKSKHSRVNVEQRQKKREEELLLAQRAADQKEKAEKKNKRKHGEAEVKDETKFQEFLSVSKSLSTSRSWDNGTPLVGETQQEQTAADVRAFEEEDDDEYQELPALKRRATEATVMTSNTTAPAASNLTDDEWLRLHRTRIKEQATEDHADPEAEDMLVDDAAEETTKKQEEQVVEEEPRVPTEEEKAIEQISESKRLFLRNLTYSCQEDDIVELFQDYGALEQVHVPVDKKTNAPKGFAYVEFKNKDDAIRAYQDLDGLAFQGRLLHILPAKSRTNIMQDEQAFHKLPLKKQRELKRKLAASASTFSWNTLYMGSDAVVSSLASRLGVKKADILNPTSSDAAVKQAMAETHVIQETKNFFEEHGVDLEAFKNSQRSDSVILAKNFPYGTTAEELAEMFGEFGELGRVLIPPAGTIAIIEFLNTPDARQAFAKLAYKRIKGSVLYLEKAPKNVFNTAVAKKAGKPEVVQKIDGISTENKAAVDEAVTEPADGETSTLFVKNISFSTSQTDFQRIFASLNGFLSAVIRAKPSKRPGQLMSMGFGFVEFRSKEDAVTAMNAMQGFLLDGHKLEIKLSHKGADAAAETRKADEKRHVKGTKILIKNLPFEATKKDVVSLFGAYGQLRSVRVPKKFDRTARGFAFAEFVTAREAENAMKALKHTHLLGRHLVLQYASTAGLDDMESAMEKAAAQITAEANAPLKHGKRLIEAGSKEE